MQIQTSQFPVDRFPITFRFLRRLESPRPSARFGRPSVRQRVEQFLRQAVVPPTSREIAQRLGANLTTVQHIIARLFTAGRTVRSVLHTGHRGRPPYVWSLAPALANVTEGGFQNVAAA